MLGSGDNAQLATWGAKAWPSDGPRFSWTDGPLAAPSSGPGARAGLYSANGTFELTVPLAGYPRKLTVFTGLFNYGQSQQSTDANGFDTGDSYINSATLRASTPGAPPVSHTVTHMDGNNNDSVNAKFEIVFEGTVTVTWALDELSRGCNTALVNCGWVSLQAATLARHSGEVGGVALFGAELMPGTS